MVALLLCLIGIYGVIAHGVGQRRREIGIRMALGARRSDVVRLMTAEGLRPAWLGAAAGLLAAAFATRFLSSLLFEVRPDDPRPLCHRSPGHVPSRP